MNDGKDDVRVHALLLLRNSDFCMGLAAGGETSDFIRDNFLDVLNSEQIEVLQKKVDDIVDPNPMYYKHRREKTKEEPKLTEEQKTKILEIAQECNNDILSGGDVDAALEAAVTKTKQVTNNDNN